jgi:hypothetical protein
MRRSTRFSPPAQTGTGALMPSDHSNAGEIAIRPRTKAQTNAPARREQPHYGWTQAGSLDASSSERGTGQRPLYSQTALGREGK